MLLGMLVALMMAPDIPLMTAVGPDANEAVQFAAEELGRYIEKASGVKVEQREVAELGDSNAVVLMFRENAARDGLHLPESEHEEAYRIYSLPDAGRGFTANSPGAVVFAVYDFLEAELDYRWYFPYPADNIQPEITRDDLVTLLRRPVDRETEPAYSFRSREFRDISPTTDKTDALMIKQIDWWAKMRMNRFLLNFNFARNPALWERWRADVLPEIQRRGMLIGLGEHGSYPLFLSPDRYAEDHPEWFCEIDGERIGTMHDAERGIYAQFCTTNEDAVATYLENFAEFVREHPEIDFYYPAPNDMGRWCECAVCRKHTVPDRYMMLNNQIVEMLNEVRPGMRTLHLAYSDHWLPPEKTLPHPKTDVDVSVWGRDFNFPLSDPRTMPDLPDYLDIFEQSEYLDVFEQWAEICRQVPGTRLLYHWKIMRHYWLGLQLLPLPVIDDDFDYIAELGMDGFDLPLGYLGIWTKALNAYVVAQKTWDPSIPADRLTDRFMQEYYGAQAEEIRAIYERAADAFRDRRYGINPLLAWHPETSKVRDAPVPGMGETVHHAIERLDEALEKTEEAMAQASAPEYGRIQKLHVVLRHARDEQLVLEKLDEVMHACYELRQNESDEARQRALQVWEEARAANDKLEASYSLKEDEAGLYWGGASHRQLNDSLTQWRDIIEDIEWELIGQWHTRDFEDSATPIIKDFDVTALLEDRLPGAFRIRFRRTGGRTVALLNAASLWIEIEDGSEVMIAEDRHAGQAGYLHVNAVYDFHIESLPPPATITRYIIKVELDARVPYDRVVERGGNDGDVMLGFLLSLSP